MSVDTRAGGSVIVFTPDDPGRAIVELSNVIQELSLRLQLLEDVVLNVNHVTPVKPRSPVIAYADGTNWNPGAGEGYYELRAAGTWHKL